MSMKSTTFPDPSKGGRTRQSDHDRTDVNLIIAAHRRGMVTAHVTKRVADYGFVPALEFRECMEQVRKAEEAFAGLPAKTRDFFHNDPVRFVEYAAKRSDLEQLVELGLLMPPEAVKPVLGSLENPIHVAPPAAPAG